MSWSKLNDSNGTVLVRLRLDDAEDCEARAAKISAWDGSGMLHLMLEFSIGARIAIPIQGG